MDKKELEEWFYEKLFNCYVCTYNINTNTKFLVYNKEYIRDPGIVSLVNIIIPFNIDNVLFELDLKNNYIFCYDRIWLFFELNYNNNYGEIVKLLRGFLINYENSSYRLPIHSELSDLSILVPLRLTYPHSCGN